MSNSFYEEAKATLMDLGLPEDEADQQLEDIGLEDVDEDDECDDCGGTGEITTQEQVWAGEPHTAPVGTKKCHCKMDI